MQKKPVILTLLFIIVLILVGAIFHVQYGLAFPIPWDDESYFIVPADSFFRKWTLEAQGLMHPRGIYWMPPMIYWIHGLVFKIVGSSSLTIARWTSFGLTVLAALGLFNLLQNMIRENQKPFSLSFQKSGSKSATPSITHSDAIVISGILTFLWFSSLPVQISSNMLRPEPISLFLGFFGLWSFLQRNYLITLSFAILALLNHPLLGLPSYCLAGLSVFHLYLAEKSGELRKSISKWEKVFFILTIGLLTCELIRMSLGIEDCIAQYRLQIQSKLNRGKSLPIYICIISMISSFFIYLFALWYRFFGRSLRNALASFLFGVAGLFIHYFGREMWYGSWLVTGWFLCSFSAFILLRQTFELLLGHSYIPARISWLQTATAPLIGAIVLLTYSRFNPIHQNKWVGFSSDKHELAFLNEERSNLLSKVDLRAYTLSGNIYVSPYLYTDIVTLARKNGVDPGKIFTSTHWSDKGLQRFAYFIDISPFFVYVLGLSQTLSSYECESLVEYSSPLRAFVIHVKKLKKSNDFQPFKECANNTQRKF